MQFVEGEMLSDSLYSEAQCIVMCYNLNDENSLTLLKTKWIPYIQTKASKSLVKLGLILVGINFKLDLDFAFPHKVALFVRGQGLQSKSLTYHTISTDDA
jgi:hypothetical protein